MTYICVSGLNTIGSDNGSSPSRRQAIIWTNDGILLIRTLRTNFSEILRVIHSFSIKKMHLKIISAKWRLFCLGLNELNHNRNQIRWRIYVALWHYNDVIMSPIGSQITSLAIIYSTVYTGADQRKHQSPASLAFVRGIHQGPVNSPHKGPVTRKTFPFYDVLMGGDDLMYTCSKIYYWQFTHQRFNAQSLIWQFRPIWECPSFILPARGLDAHQYTR